MQISFSLNENANCARRDKLREFKKGEIKDSEEVESE